MSALRLGRAARAPIQWTFEKIESVRRILLMNADESGSMAGSTDKNVAIFDRMVAAIGARFDVIVVHGFESDSDYQITAAPDFAALFREVLAKAKVRGSVAESAAIAADARAGLVLHQARGSTNPKSHPVFLAHLADALDAFPGSVELSVVNTSDGGLDGSSPKAEIQRAMMRVVARCRCRLVVNLLVGSAGSPSALNFFTGDADAFDSRLLLSTVKANEAEGVLAIESFEPGILGQEDAGGSRITTIPGIAYLSTESDRLVAWWPDGQDIPPTVTIRKHTPQPGGREVTMSCALDLAPSPVEIDADAREICALIARCHDDNPYVRDESRAGLNAMIADLEGLAATRDRILQNASMTPEEAARTGEIEARLAANTAAFGEARSENRTLRERSARINALNNARRLIKQDLREAHEEIAQTAIERELAFVQEHPDHWVVWLKPALDVLRAQLSRTQVEVGSEMAHLSTRIRSKKSREDGQSRSVDRHIDALLARSRSRNDAAGRRADPADQVALDRPPSWTDLRCPVTGDPIASGLAGLPFVMDRGDITSGNVACGGQNVDRVPVEVEPLLAMRAVRELMWANNGQMAAPFATGGGVYNAAIPVLVGPATPAGLRDLEKAIGWLCTGTSAFEPPMAEAVPGALAGVLGRPGDDDPLRIDQANALLRTTALFGRYASYPYVAGTQVLDEAAPKIPLPEVWTRSLAASGDAASLQSSGCVTSLLAKAVGATEVDLVPTVRGMFSWVCRNIARSILGTPAADGRGGVEGIRRLAALFRHAIEIDGYPAASPEATAPSDDTAGEPFLDPGLLSAILGADLLPLWNEAPPVPAGDAVATLNAWISALPRERAIQVVDALPALFERLDRLAPPPANLPAAPIDTREQGVAIEPVYPGHFEIPALESVRPLRAFTPTPGLADAALAMRRVLKASKTRWIPPQDAMLPLGSVNPSAVRFFDAHSAAYPLRALLRLAAAGCLGQPALAELRASPERREFPRIDRVFAEVSRLIGRDETALLLLRAFAFVVEEANGYADKRWAESPLRSATLEKVEEILYLLPQPPKARPVAYGPAPFRIPPAGIEWPKMIGKGYLPKSRGIDATGATVTRPFRLAPEDAALADEMLCRKRIGEVLVELESQDALILSSLHRSARSVLGAWPEDLRESKDLARVFTEELVPRLAGKVGGDPQHPRFFEDVSIVLREMIALGYDTRTFQAAEPEDLIRAEAEAIRAGI